MLARLLLAAVVAAVGSHQGIGVHVERVAGNRVDFEVTYEYGGRDRFVGYANGGRPTWLTTCFLREFYGKLCTPAPAGVAPGPAPEWVLPARFAHPLDPGLIRPEALAVAKDGSLLILDSFREELFRRAPDGSLHAVAPIDGWKATVAVAPNGDVYVGDGARIRVLGHGTLRQRFGAVRSLAFFDGSLYVETARNIVELKNGRVGTVVRPRGFFSPDLFAIGGDGNFYVYSGGTKTIEELTPSGKQLHQWRQYADALATAPDGSVVVGSHFGALVRIRDGKLSTISVDVGFTFQPDGVAVGRDGTIYVDTFVGNGYTNQTALAAVTPDGRARLLRTTAHPFSSAACPSADGLQPFDSAARRAAVRSAEVVDIPPFERGLRLVDPAWREGFYTDQIDGRYEIGRHHVYSARSASADPYADAVARRCGSSLVHDSLAVVVGPGVYSDQVSHMFFLDRKGRALLYWQHT